MKERRRAQSQAKGLNGELQKPTCLRASGCLGQQAPEYWLQTGEKGLCVAMETLKLMKLCIKVGEIYVSKLWFGKT